MTGQTLSIFTGLTTLTASISSMYTPNMLVISKPGTSNELLKISAEGEIFYNVNDEMIKVNCPEDVAEAFIHVVFGYSNSTPEDVIIQKYINKILNHERSNEYMTKLEKTFRKLKLEKISKNQ
jgi:hypothetical protein